MNSIPKNHQNTSEELFLRSVLEETSNLPRRNDWFIKLRLVGSFLLLAVLCLIGVPIGFFIARMEPAKALLLISLLGFILIVAAPIGFIYYFGKAIYIFLRPFDSRTLLEYLVPELFNYCIDKENVEKIKVPWQFILPSTRDRYRDFYDISRKICEREVQRRGGGYISCKCWRVTDKQKDKNATCIVELVRARTDTRKSEPLAQLILQTVKSTSGSWYLIVPDPEKIESCLHFTPL